MRIFVPIMAFRSQLILGVPRSIMAFWRSRAFMKLIAISAIMVSLLSVVLVPILYFKSLCNTFMTLVTV